MLRLSRGSRSVSGGELLIAEHPAVTLLRFVAGMGIHRRSTLRPYWLGRARWLVRLRASSSAVAWEPGCAILQPFVGSAGNGPCGLTLPLQHGTRICRLRSEISDFKSKSTATSPGRLLCSSSDACAILHVRRQAEPSASREVLVPYSVRQPRCDRCPVRPALGRSRFGVGIFLC